MEVRTQEVIRYIDLRFKEQDLKELSDELDRINNYFGSDSYRSNKEFYNNLKKIKEFYAVVRDALGEIKS